MSNVVIKIKVHPTSRSVPAPSFVGVPSGGSNGQFLSPFGWQYPDAGVATITRKAHGALSGHRAVYAYSPTHVAYADQDDDLSVGKIVGLTTGSAANGDDVVIQGSGILIEPGWDWEPGYIYLASNGTLTQEPPTTGNLVILGSSVNSTAIHIDIKFVSRLT